MKEKSKKSERPVIGVPFFMTQNPYQAGTIPPTAIFGDPMDAPIQETIYRDTPAPFHCPFCGNTGLTDIRFFIFIFIFRILKIFVAVN